MSEKQFIHLKNELRPFFTLLLVVASSLFLASCGGGSGSTAEQATNASVGEDGRKEALAVPGTWTGRVPTGVDTSTSPNISFRTYTIPQKTIKGDVSQGKIVAGEIVVLLRAAQDMTALRSYVATKGYKIVFIGGNILNDVIIQTYITSESALLHEIDSLETLAWVTLASTNSVGASNGFTDYQWTNQTYSWSLKAIGYEKAFDLSTGYHANKVNVGIIDSGFMQHDDVSFSAIVGVSSATDWHGLRVASIIAAKPNNAKGAVGLSPGAQLHARESSFEWSSVYTPLALQMLNSDIRVVNMSFGTHWCDDSGVIVGCETFPSLTPDQEYKEGNRHLAPLSSILRTAEKNNKSMLLVQSSGNAGAYKWGQPFQNAMRISAEFNNFAAWIGRFKPRSSNDKVMLEHVAKHTLIVGAFCVDDNGNKAVAAYTQTPLLAHDGAENLRDRFILAPSGCDVIFPNSIYTATGPQTDYYGGGVLGFSGTSAAAPHVSGVAALLMQIMPELSASEVANIILNTASTNRGDSYVDHPYAVNGYDGYRYLNAEAAVKEAIRLKNISNCGTVTPPFQTAGAPVSAVHSVISGQPTNFTTIPSISFADYKWKTSESTSVVSSGSVPSAAITFNSPSATATLTVTPVLADGTECKEQAQTANVMVSMAPISIKSTGVDINGAKLPQGQADPHWKVISGPGIDSPQQAVSSFVAEPYFRGAPASWIWVNSSGSASINAYYTFQRQVDIGNADPDSIMLTGQWAADNLGEVYINGVQATGTGTLAILRGDTTSLAAPHPFAITSGFKPGLNTIEFRVMDIGQPGGLLAWDLKVLPKVINSTTPSVFIDVFASPTIDATKWVNNGYADFGGTVTSSATIDVNGIAQFPSDSALNTKGKLTFSGSKIVVEARMAGLGGSRDTHINLIDVQANGFNDYFRLGDSNYWGGMYVQAGGIFTTPSPYFNQTADPSTNQWMEYRLTIEGDQVTAERGLNLSNITHRLSFKASRSIIGRSFHLYIGTGGYAYSPGSFDWIRVTTTP